MRFVLIGPVYPYKGGIAQYTTMLSEKLSGCQHDLLLISYKRQYPKLMFPGGDTIDPSSNPFLAKNPFYWIDSLNPISWIKTFLRIYHFKPDIIILQWWTSFWAVFLITISILTKIFLNTKSVLICHNVIPHESHWGNRWLMKITCRWISHFIVHSDAEKAVLLEIIPNATLDVVPLPIFDQFADQRKNITEARLELQIKQDSRVLLFFGNVRQYKGLEDLLAAFSEVKKQLDDIILIIAGEFWKSKRKYLKLIKELDIQSEVIIYDYYIPNEQIGTFFSAADLLVAPYKSVTGSGVVRIAESFGLPTLTTFPNPITDNTWINFYVPPGDIEALKDKIIRFFRSHKKENHLEQPTSNNSWMDLVSTLEKISPLK